MNAHKSILQWADDCLKNNDYVTISPAEVIVETPWSSVFNLKTNRGMIYIKQTPPDLFIESKLTTLITNNFPGAPVPTILFENHNLNCYLMTSRGDQSLRAIFNGKINTELLFAGLKSYINIQRSLQSNLRDFDEIGVPNWRINLIPKLYIELIEQKMMLLEEGLSGNEIEKLSQLIPKIESICQYLAKQKIKESLINADFNEGNMVLNEETQ